MRSSIHTIHWVCNSPSPYNDQLFRRLNAALSVKLQFHFTRSNSAIHEWAPSQDAGFPSRCYRRWLGVDWGVVQRVCRDSGNLFLTNCWQDPTSQIILLFCIVTDRPYLIWNDTPSLSRKRNFVKRSLRSAFLRLVLRHASVVLGTGKVAISALAEMGCPETKLLDFPYFIDLDEFFFSERHEGSCQVVFGSVGRLHRDKGYDLALRALAQLAAQKSFDFQYRIAGTGPEADSLRALSTKLGISNRVEFLGWVKPDQLPAFYRSVDFLLHPARTEPFGVSILESMASGTIVIASDQTAAAVDRVSDGVNGFLHPSNDVNSLAACINKTLRSGSDAKASIRVLARQTAESWPTSRGVDTISELLRGLTAPLMF